MVAETIRTRAWAWYLAAVVFVGQYYVVSAFGTDSNETLYVVLGGSALVAGLVGLALQRPARLLAWVLMVGSIGAYLAADAILADLEANNPFPPFPSLADWLYLGIYPALAVAFIAIRRSLAPGADRRATVDAAIVGAATLGVLGPLYLIETWNSPFLDTQQQWVATAYPLGDALLMTVGARLVFAAGRRVNALSLLGGAAISVTIGNAVYNAEALGAGFETGGLGSIGWVAFLCLLGAAALHPSVRFAGTSAADSRRPLPNVVRVAAVAVVAAAHLRWGDADSRLLTAVCLGAIVVLGSMRELRRRDEHSAEVLETTVVSSRQHATADA